MAYLYILECADGTYYTGSTQDLSLRLEQHQCGMGANYTSRRLPVKFVYCRYYDRIDDAFLREKQVQGWSHAKKKALIASALNDLPRLSKNYAEFGRPVPSVVSTPRQARGSPSSTTDGNIPS
jgi:putative endonuclease